MAFAKTPSIVFMRGGTDASFTPPIDYMTNVTAFYYEKFGLPSARRLCSGNSSVIYIPFTSGYYLQGGGEVRLNVEPLKKCLSFCATSELAFP